jgi:hypothetical protein
MDQDYRFEDFYDDADKLFKEILATFGDDSLRAKLLNGVFIVLCDNMEQYWEIDSVTDISTCNGSKPVARSKNSSSLNSQQKKIRTDYLSCSVLEPLLSRVASVDSASIFKSNSSPAPASVVETVFDSGRSVGISLARLQRKKQ